MAADDNEISQVFRLKEEQKRLMEDGTYTRQQSYETARQFGRLLSYTEEGIARLIEKTEKQKTEGDPDRGPDGGSREAAGGANRERKRDR